MCRGGPLSVRRGVSEDGVWLGMNRQHIAHLKAIGIVLADKYRAEHCSATLKITAKFPFDLLVGSVKQSARLKARY